MNIYITKYALARGIIEIDAFPQEDLRTLYVGLSQYPHPQYYYKPDWHITMQSAVARANEMKVQAIDNLIEKINAPGISQHDMSAFSELVKKLEALEFGSPYLKPEVLAESRALDEIRKAAEGPMPLHSMRPCNPPAPAGR
jgi:hypothetical protein